MGGCCSGWRWDPGRPASGASGRISPGWRSRMVGWRRSASPRAMTATVALACDRPIRWARSLADVSAGFDGPRHGRRRGDRANPAGTGRAPSGEARSAAPAPRRAAGRDRHPGLEVRGPVPRAPCRRRRSVGPPRPIGPVPRLTVDRTQAPPALDRSTVLGRRQRPVAEFDECVVGGQAPHRRPDRIGADPVRVLGGGFGRMAHRPGPSRKDLEARHVGLARAARDAVTPRIGSRGRWRRMPMGPSPSRSSTMSPSTVDRPGRFTSARTTTKATTTAMTSATTPRAGPSVAVDRAGPARREGRPRYHRRRLPIRPHPDRAGTRTRGRGPSRSGQPAG